MKTADELAAERALEEGTVPPGGFRLGAQDAAPPTAAAREVGFIRRLFVQAGNWGELRRTPYGLQPVLILGGISMLRYLGGSIFEFGRPEIARDLDITLGGLIFLLQLVGVVSIVVAIFVGWWADRHPRTPLIAAGAVGSGIFHLITAGAGGMVSFGAPTVGDTVSEEVGAVPRFSLYADYYPPETRGKAFALNTMLYNIGRVGSPLIVGAVIYFLGWREGYVIFGIPLILMGVLALARLREPVRGYMERKALGATEAAALREDDPQSFGEAWRATWSIRTLRRIFMSDIFLWSGLVIFGLLVPLYLAEEYGLNALERGFIFMPLVVGSLLGGYLGGGLVDFFIRRNPGRIMTLVAVFSVVSAVGYAFVALGLPLWVIAPGLFFAGFGLSLTGPALKVVYAQVIPPSVRTQGLQMTDLARLPGLIIFLQVAGVLQNEYGYETALQVSIPFFLISAAIFATAGQFFDVDMRNAYAASLAAEEWRRAKASGQAKLLVCRQVDVEYSGVQVLFGVDFDVEEGDIIALLGTNGAGKSTLLRAIGGITEASGGAVVFDGRDITHMPPNEIAGRGVITMPGGRGVFPGLTVRENLLLGNWMTDEDEEVRTRLRDVFEIFPVLRDRADATASALSGGEQQMLSLAQAFLSRPRLLMIDELSLGLSPAVVQQLLEIVRRIHAEGTTIIVVEQSVSIALTLAERAIFMEKGEVRFVGRTADLLRRPDILRAVYVKGTGALTSSVGSAVRSEREQRALELGHAAPVLEADTIVKRFGGVVALNGVSVELRQGEVLGLIGPNGSGKTTLFDILSGYQRPDEGIVRFEGVDITNLGPEARARAGLVRRFQDARLFSSLTVFETLLVALEQRMEVRSALLGAFSLPQARRAERRVRIRAERLIELLDLGAYRDKFVKELSTGLRRIVDLACVLAAEPTVLLLDEPSSGIAQAEAESLGPLLRRVRFETGCSIMIIEHDMPLISAVADELVALENGAVIVRGSPEDVLNDERVIESYLGTSEATLRRDTGR